MTDFRGTADFKCPTPGCGLPARFIHAIVQESINAAHPEEAKFYLVECPKHGEKLIKLEGGPTTNRRNPPRAAS